MGIILMPENRADAGSAPMANVLVTDQESRTRNLIAEVLTDMGYLVKATPDSAKAMQLAQRSCFDVLILDESTCQPEALRSIVQFTRSRNPCATVIGLGSRKSRPYLQPPRVGDPFVIAKPISLGGLIRAVRRASSSLDAFSKVESAPVSPASAALDLDELCRLPLREARERFERAYFAYHVAATNGRVSRLMQRVGLDRTHLYRKLSRLGLSGIRRDCDPERERY